MTIGMLQNNYGAQSNTTKLLWKLCKAFLFQRPLDLNIAIVGSMYSNWITLPTSHGGLGLPCILDFSSQRGVTTFTLCAFASSRNLRGC
uniref:AlNc14C22G2239 protein n=1 Tax=Albugo laibachii Nc14 TaxID=890382 RepID=F0W5S4_9STRA|nr:AlNc14C22G2239 [Albugo laibachii Nc14]|eukprot:CCA16465.1 AlNc14C22G2239 [Albugo laibachii Nc14]